MPSVWSADSKSFEAHASTTPWLYAYCTAPSIEGVCPRAAVVTSITFAPESTANTIASATRSGRSIASSPILTLSKRHPGQTPTPAKWLLAVPTSFLCSPLAWP